MNYKNKILVFDDPDDFLKVMDYLKQQYKNKNVNEAVKNNNSGVGRECH